MEILKIDYCSTDLESNKDDAVTRADWFRES